MTATRHSPSRCIATFPVSNAFDAENSSPAPALKRTRLSQPYQSIRLFCQRRSASHSGVASADLSPSIHVAPHEGAKCAGTFSYQLGNGLNPTTFSLPLASFCVSFFASAVSSEIVFGGDLIPAFASSVL